MIYRIKFTSYVDIEALSSEEALREAAKLDWEDFQQAMEADTKEDLEIVEICE